MTEKSKVVKRAEYVIEKGIPPPSASLTKTLRLMRNGDSVLVTDRGRTGVTAAMSNVKRIVRGSKFVSRREGVGIRVWRLQ